MTLHTNNINIIEEAPLASPEQLLHDLPLTPEQERQIDRHRHEIADVLDGRSKRLLMIVGPCSIHNPKSALQYAQQLKVLADRFQDRLLIVMRAYFEKPRTTVGWKGLIYDPDLNSSYNIAKGLHLARKILLDIVGLGLPVATEMLDPITAQYTADTISWAAIGARTTEAQTHRQLASGLSMPVGFKNATDGSFQTAIDAITAARSQHSFIGLRENGQVGIFRTKGNAYAHLVLRGGNGHANYAAENIAFLQVALKKAHLPQMLVIDCSHANSNKDYRKQGVALRDVLGQIKEGCSTIRGVMLESNLEAGSQKIQAGVPVRPGQSITDSCIGWEETVQLLQESYEAMSPKSK